MVSESGEEVSAPAGSEEYRTAYSTVYMFVVVISGEVAPPPPPCLSTCFSNRPGGVQKRQLIVMLQRYELCSRGSRYELCSRGSRYELCSRGSRFTHKSRILRQFTLEFLSIIGYLIFSAVSLEYQVLGPKCTALIMSDVHRLWLVPKDLRFFTEPKNENLKKDTAKNKNNEVFFISFLKLNFN